MYWTLWTPCRATPPQSFIYWLVSARCSVVSVHWEPLVSSSYFWVEWRPSMCLSSPHPGSEQTSTGWQKLHQNWTRRAKDQTEKGWRGEQQAKADHEKMMPRADEDRSVNVQFSVCLNSLSHVRNIWPEWNGLRFIFTVHQSAFAPKWSLEIIQNTKTSFIFISYKKEAAGTNKRLSFVAVFSFSYWIVGEKYRYLTTIALTTTEMTLTWPHTWPDSFIRTNKRWKVTQMMINVVAT